MNTSDPESMASPVVWRGDDPPISVGDETSQWLALVTEEHLKEEEEKTFQTPHNSEYHRPIVGLVSTKNPTLALVGTVTSLLNGGASRVLVIDDGSDNPECSDFFRLAEEVGAVVLHMPENVGKSSALRAGYLSLPDDPRIIIVQTDDDTLAGDLRVPAAMIERGQADIIDIRIETFDGRNLIGLVQQLDYWLINAFIKRFQDWLRARLWVSGASMMYTYDAAEVMLLPEARTQTEDTEGRYRAIAAGLRLRFCASPKAQFKTMVPESRHQLHRQWKRWATGNGQIIKLHGFGGGSRWIATISILSWVEMLTSPVAQFFTGNLFRRFIPSIQVPGQAVVMKTLGPVGSDLLTGLLWMGIFGAVVGVIGAIQLRRPALLLVGFFIPILSLLWTAVAIEGLIIAQKHPDAKGSLSWEPPTRMVMTADDVDALASTGAGS